ncbi:MAG TPA: carbohydrate kinase family protein [Acidimicrobiales bacterium]|nr:carbohydrate kinase family protein [Acidimicrobiales bacterium]
MGFVTPAQRYDVISVGDVATDLFIRLSDNQVERRVDERGTLLEFPLGAKIPYEKATTVEAGGSAANAAVAFARLGLRVALASFLAHDELGRDLLGALHTERVDTRLVHVDSPAHTNRNFVLLLNGEQTILVRHERFDYHWPHLRPSEVPTWLYVTSLGPHALDYQDKIADWLDENSAVRMAFQPGTFQIEAGTERLARLYGRAEVLVCGRTQAVAITGGHSGDSAQLLGPLMKLGPREVVVVDETGGAVAADGTKRYLVPPFPDSSAPLDRTGAEDAFAATLAAALIRGMPFAEALSWPAVNFMSVSHELGSQAGLLHEDELRGHLAEMGDAYAVHLG